MFQLLRSIHRALLCGRFLSAALLSLRSGNLQSKACPAAMPNRMCAFAHKSPDVWRHVATIHHSLHLAFEFV